MSDERAIVKRVEEAHPLSARAIRSQVQLIQNMMKEVMKEGEHFGTIPHCGDKKVLFKAGAEKLGLTFRLVPRYEIQRHNEGKGHREYEVSCSLTACNTGLFVGQGIGSCSTMESKYRWRTAKLACPGCGMELRKSKNSAEFYCWAKKGGCGATFRPDDEAITKQPCGRVENADIADCYNTVLKMAKKRAFVDAILTATAASDCFTQDLQENHEANREGERGNPVDDSPSQDRRVKEVDKWAEGALKPADDLEAYRKSVGARIKEAGYGDTEGWKRLCKALPMIPTWAETTRDHLSLILVHLDRLSAKRTDEEASGEPREVIMENLLAVAKARGISPNKLEVEALGIADKKLSDCSCAQLQALMDVLRERPTVEGELGQEQLF